MAKMYDVPKFATIIEGESLTEQEHISSCDISKMIHDLGRGLQIRGSTSESRYGEDDTTLDGLQFRIAKEKLERELAQIAQNEFTEEELALIPDKIKKTFGFKKPKSKQAASKNDDQTTKPAATTSSPTTPEPSEPPKTSS